MMRNKKILNRRMHMEKLPDCILSRLVRIRRREIDDLVGRCGVGFFGGKDD